MKKFKISLLAGVVALISLSCSTENVPIDNVKSDRLSFKNNDEFHETYQMLAKMNSRAELEQWARSKNHKTLLYSEDPSIENYSDILKTILNEDAEYQLGDDIVWFNKGDLYSFSKEKITTLSTLKKDLSKCHKVGFIKLNRIETSETEAGRTDTYNLPLGGLEARHQREFTQKRYRACDGSGNDATGSKKYVHEIYDESYGSNPGPVYTSYLHLRIKLEWRGRRWKPAGEQREIRVNVSGTANMMPSGVGGAFAIPDTFYDCSLDKDFIIKAVQGAYPYPPYWVVSMTGSIYQKVRGDNDTNAWTNSGTLW